MFGSPARFLSGVAAIVAALLLAPCAAYSAPDAAEDLKLVPADSNLVVVLQMDKLLASDSFKKLRKEIPEIDREMDKSFRREFGFDIGNVERMIAAGKVQTQGMYVFRCKSAIKPADVIKTRSEPAFKDAKGTTFTEEKIGTRTLYVPSQAYETAFVLLDDKTMVAGETKVLKPLLEDAKKLGLPMSLQPVAKAADMNANIVMLMDVKSMTAGWPAPPNPPFDDIAKAILGTKGAVLTVQVGPEVTVRGLALCNDAAAAELAKKAADAGLVFVAGLMKEAEKGGKKIPKELLDLPGKIKTNVKGDTAEATLTVKDDVAIAFIKATIHSEPSRVNPEPKPSR
jgi:hypothetical protein